MSYPPLSDPAVPAGEEPVAEYVAPTVQVLGSLATLTLGGTDAADPDGWGGAGASGDLASI